MKLIKLRHFICRLNSYFKGMCLLKWRGTFQGGLWSIKGRIGGMPGRPMHLIQRPGPPMFSKNYQKIVNICQCATKKCHKISVLAGLIWALPRNAVSIFERFPIALSLVSIYSTSPHAMINQCKHCDWAKCSTGMLGLISLSSKLEYMVTVFKVLLNWNVIQ